MKQRKELVKSKKRSRCLLENKSGRKGGFTALLENYGDEPASEYGGGSGSNKEALANKLWELALSGNLTAIKYIFDRLDGRPTERQTIDTGPSGAEGFVLLLQKAHAEIKKSSAGNKQ